MKLFNFSCTNNLISDKIINGCNIGLIDPNATKYNIFYKIFKLMIECNWVPEEVDLSNDKNDYNNLSDIEKEGYSKVLAQLIFMDSIQTENTSGNVIPFITEPVAIAALTRQAYDEANHSDSYYRMADSIYEEPEKIYNMWKKDEILRDKNTYIGNVYEKYSFRATESDDLFLYRTSFFFNILKNINEKELKKYILNMLNTASYLTKVNKRKYSINLHRKKEEILNNIKNSTLKNIIKNINFNNISDTEIDNFVLSLKILEEELNIIQKCNSFEEYIKIEKKLRFDSRVLMIIANQALEGIYFYSGFVLIYALGRQGKMLGSTDMIRFIHRDEINHTLLYSSLFKYIYKENKEKFDNELFSNCVDILKNAALLEIKWGEYIIQDKIPGITNNEIRNYIKFLANDRFRILELNKIDNLNMPFPEVGYKNPLSWVNKFSQLKNTKTNFFEGTNKNYDNKGLNVNIIEINNDTLNKIIKEI